MGLFGAIFGNQKQREAENYFQAFTAYTPAYTTFGGGLYEMELVRAVIHSFATACSNEITFAMNLIQYASNSTRLQMSTQMFDRGLMSINMVMDLWRWERIEGGEKRYIRKEYSQLDKLHENPDDDKPTTDPEIPLGDNKK